MKRTVKKNQMIPSISSYIFTEHGLDNFAILGATLCLIYTAFCARRSNPMVLAGQFLKCLTLCFRDKQRRKDSAKPDCYIGIRKEYT
jgi:hypothetical protein